MKVDTKAIRARAEAATKGPWEAKFQDNDNGTWADVLAGDVMVCECATSICDHLTPQNRRDMEFVSSCRTDVPALCIRVEALEAALSVALGLYSNPESTSEVGYAQYRMACAVLEGE